MLDALRGIFAITFIALHTVFWCTPLYVIGLVRLAIPAGRRRTGGVMNRIVDGWVASNRVLFRVLNLTTINAQFTGTENLSRTGWYLVLSNHQTWADIIVLQNTFLGRIPPLKFFTKRELIWVPLLGVAMWLLGFPYVRRYSRELLAANPELRDHDKNATLRACDGFKERPTSVLNFLEGTRFTKAKHEAQQSPYRHLLMPRSGGLGYVAEALGERVVNVLDVTIDYPNGVPTFWEFLCGRCRAVDVRIDGHGVPEPLTLLRGGNGREELKRWVDDLWRRKDERISGARA